METPQQQRQGSAELFRSLFGSLSGGLSLFANNPFRKRKPQEGEEDPHTPASHSAITGTNQTPSLSKPQKDTTHGIDPPPSTARLRVRFEGLDDAEPPSKAEKKKHAKEVRASSAPNGRMEDRAPASELVETKKRARAALEQSDREEEKRDLHAEGPLQKQKGSKPKNAKVATEQKLEEQVKGPVTKKMKAMAEKEQEEQVQLFKENMNMAAGESLGKQVKKPKLKKMKTEQESDLKPETTILSEGAAATVKKGKQGKRVQDVLDRDAPRKRQKVSLGEGDLPSSTSNMGAITMASKKKSVKHPDVDSGQSRSKKRKKDESIEERYENKLAGLSSSKTADESKPKLLKSEAGENTDGAKISQSKKIRKGVDDEDDDDAVKARKFDDEEKLKRTIFVGNLPLKVKKKAIIREFSRYGALESARLRSIPLLDTKIPRKGAVIKGQINEAVNSQHAYLVFKEKASADAALAHNMKEFNGHHLRVDIARAPHEAAKGKSLSLYDHTRSIFVGNVPFNVKDEELYRLFNIKKPPEMGVEAIRVVRDPQTSRCIGIAYVLFKTKAGARRVLAATRNIRLRDRLMRVSPVLSTQNEEKRHRPAKRVKPTEASEASPQRKRAKLSSSYEGIRATRSSSHLGTHTIQIKEKFKSTNNSNVGHSSTFIGKREQVNKTPLNLTGEKRKRVENRQRGISRSKKIRRS